jgi:hypothetical protein
MRKLRGWRRVLRWLAGLAIGLVGLVVFAVIGFVMSD